MDAALNLTRGSLVTAEARRYAVRELARRAGVPEDWLQSWRVQTTATETIVTLGPIIAQVRFPHDPEGLAEQIASNQLRVARMAWPDRHVPRAYAKVRDFVVPFASDQAGSPLFEQQDACHAQCTVDLLTSITLTLSRFEETISSDRDEHGRFTARQSIAHRDGHLNRPIVDEYGLAFEQLLTRMVPRFRPEPRRLRVNLSHDVDEVGIPFQWRTVVGHTVRRRQPAATLRDLTARFRKSVRPMYLESVLRLARLSNEHKLHSAFFWKASPRTKFDSGYDPRRASIRQAIQELRTAGFECGVHPGYDTFQRPEELAREIKTLRDVLGTQELGGRQHYLRWSPQTWLDWERLGLRYDSSVGYADHVGFRAGTCYPYHPWLVSENRESRLIELPLIAMDCSLTQYMGLRGDECLGPLRECASRCRVVGGVFTLLWHPHSLIDPSYGSSYQQILRELAGHPGYECPSTYSGTRPAQIPSAFFDVQSKAQN